MMDSLNLVVVSDYSYSAGGIEQFVYELLARARVRWATTLITWTDSTLAPSEGVRVHVPEFGDLRSSWEIFDRADVIVIVTSFNVRLLARAAGDYLRRRPCAAVVVVQTSQHSDPGAMSVVAQDAWLSELWADSQAVVAVSEEVRSGLERLSPSSVALPSVELIENGARLCTSDRDQRSRRKKVTFVGRPHPQKGYHLFTRLAKSLAGEGLEFHANTVSISVGEHDPGISYSHNLSARELEALFLDTDLMVVPYLRADGLPLALLEALNCGVPVIGFDSPGVGPLLHRHDQIVIEASYTALEDAVRRWAAGSLVIRPPEPGHVASWDEQIGLYMDLLDSVVVV